MIEGFEDFNYRDFEKRFIRKFRKSKYWDNRAGLSKTVQDDMLKWRKKLLQNRAFHATLVNLQNFCDVSNLTPNDVLLPSEMVRGGVDQIEYITFQTTEALVTYLAETKQEIKRAQSFPLVFSIKEMMLLSMEVYVSKGKTRDVMIRFHITEFAGDVTKNDWCNTTPAVDLECQEIAYCVSSPHRNQYSFSDAYNMAKADFDDRYELGQITQQYQTRSRLLLTWLPQSVCKGKLFTLFPAQPEDDIPQKIGVSQSLDEYIACAGEASGK